MTSNKTIYIWDGGVFSPPTKAVGKLAYNMATYISSKDKTRVEYHFVPTNKHACWTKRFHEPLIVIA